MDSALYKFLLLLHILAVIVAFGPAFAIPMMTVRARKVGGAAPEVLASLVQGITVRVTGTATALVGVFGILLVISSDEIWKFSQAWVSIALLLWILVLALQYGLMAPAEKKAATGDEGAARKLSMFTGFQHVALLGALVVMIWKPGGA